MSIKIILVIFLIFLINLVALYPDQAKNQKVRISSTDKPPNTAGRVLSRLPKVEGKFRTLLNVPSKCRKNYVFFSGRCREIDE